jgi:hypothetical protein
MTARDEILIAARGLSSASPDGTFTVQAVVDMMRRAGTTYKESTVRTHVVSRMCADAPDNHAKVYDDFVRVSAGRYRLR